jgi:HAD superfamily hydrolase (TIGR01509 family)
MTLKNIRHVVFDFDGTVGDSYAPVTESLNHALRRFGLRELATAEVRPWVGAGLEDIFEHYAGADLVAEGVRIYREKYRTIHRQGTVLMPGAGEMLDALDGRVTMGLCSNKLGELLRELCESLGVTQRFAVILGAGDVPRMKPHPDMLREAMRRLGATDRDTIYVGDTTIDAEFAAACGVPCVLVLGGSGTREELAAAKPVALLDHIAGLPALFGMNVA